MRLITDFHLHSRFSRACSKDLTISNIAKACERKGIQFIGTSDFTHPGWRAELEADLEPMESGVFRLKHSDSPTRFFLATEISSIYKRGGKTRRVHNLISLSSFEAMRKFVHVLEARGCNLKSDGRPIIGIDSEELVKLVLDADHNGLLIPAHAWTPWFAVFGSQSGFDSLEECFGEMTKHVYAIETGLSSDPKMNWQLSQLDDLFLVSNSDAHSLDKLGREANVFEMEKPSYLEFVRILREHDCSKFVETIEFFPEEGKYHLDGHRDCKFFSDPKQTKRLNGVCPVCGKPLTIGVSHRVDDLADREVSTVQDRVPFRSIVPLAEIIADVVGVSSVASKKVTQLYDRLVADGRTEFGILLDLPIDEIVRASTSEMGLAIERVRRGELYIRPGYDGEYGVISVLNPDERKPIVSQAKLFE